MQFLSPAALIGGLLAIPIILLYMLKLRRQEVRVSSNFLWEQLLVDREANTPWQRLKRNLLLILQLIILALIIVALMRPYIVVPTITSGKTVILLDASASMLATDTQESSRFETALKLAHELVDRMNPLDELSIIRVADSVEPLTPYTANFSDLHQALDTVQAGQGAADWDTALTLAVAGASNTEVFTIIILSDGGIQTNFRLPDHINEPVYIPIGQSDSNLAISALAIGSLAGQNPELFAQVKYYGENSTTEADISLVISLDGVNTFSETRRIPAGESASFSFPIEQDFTTIQAELINRDSTVPDYLSLDNFAYASGTAKSSRRVLLISEEPNIFLEQVLKSLPGLQTFRGDANNSRLPDTPYDLYIFDHYLPQAYPQEGALLIINPPRNSPFFKIGADQENVGTLQVNNPNDERVSFLETDSIHIRKIKSLEVSFGESLIDSEAGSSVLYAGDINGQQIAILPFKLNDSDLPLQIAFPILMSNLINWFTPANLVLNPQNLSVGDTVTIRPNLEADQILITLPDKTVRMIEAQGHPLNFAETQSTGFYLVESLKDAEVLQDQIFAINLFGTNESMIQPLPVDALNLGGSVVDEAVLEQAGIRELWWVFAGLALILLLIEWLLYHRRLRLPKASLPNRPNLSSRV